MVILVYMVVNLYLLPILTVWQKKVHGSINIIVHLLSVLLRVCGLLTGMYPGKWHITTYLQGKAGNKAAEMADYLDPSAPTLPKVMKNAGYKTGHFGKWHLGGGRGVSGMLPLLSLMDMTNIAAPMKALNRIRYLRQRIGFGLRRIV